MVQHYVPGGCEAVGNSGQQMKKILVIDDEVSLREMAHLALAQKGFDVIEAENGAVGVDKARKELPDLILCDVNMRRWTAI